MNYLELLQTIALLCQVTGKYPHEVRTSQDRCQREYIQCIQDTQKKNNSGTEYSLWLCVKGDVE